MASLLETLKSQTTYQFTVQNSLSLGADDAMIDMYALTRDNIFPIIATVAVFLTEGKKSLADHSIQNISNK